MRTKSCSTGFSWQGFLRYGSVRRRISRKRASLFVLAASSSAISSRCADMPMSSPIARGIERLPDLPQQVCSLSRCAHSFGLWSPQNHTD